MLAALGLLALPVQAAPPPLALEGWEYRWGDSPAGPEGRPAWLTEASGWQAIDFPSNPPGRQGQQHAWFRTTLPDGEWRDPVLYITSIDLIGQLYLDGELLYQYGEFDAEGRGDFAGWPWHMIELPADFAGATLHLRVYSYYTDIGLWGEVQLMDRLDGLNAVLQNSAKALAVGTFCLLLAVLALLFALLGPQRHGFVGIALFASASGLMLLAEAPARQLLLERALWWDTLRAASYFTLPVAMSLLLAHWLDGAAARWMRWLWRLHLAYLAGALTLVQAGAISLSLTFPAFDALLAITLPLMLLLALWQVPRLGMEQRLIVASFVLFAPLLLVDMLVAHGFVSWRSVPLSTGALGFALAIAGLSLWDYRRTQQRLAELNRSLERQVAERTAELDRLVETLEGYSYQDALTGLKNRRYFDELLDHEARSADREGQAFSLVLMDLDHFKQVNDRYGHEGGDQVLRQFATLLQAHFRDSDVVCRLGGEEFVALLPGADPANAAARAAAVTRAVGQHAFRCGTEAPFRVTLSCGVASYPAHTADPLALVGLADHALYCAKRSGRNRIVTWTPDAEGGHSQVATLG